MTADIKKNKVRNEEYKIWKKSVPFLYQHISSVRPRFDSRVEDTSKFEKRLTFTDKVVPDKKKGLRVSFIRREAIFMKLIVIYH